MWLRKNAEHPSCPSWLSHATLLGAKRWNPSQRSVPEGVTNACRNSSPATGQTENHSPIASHGGEIVTNVRVEQGNSYLAECIAGARDRVVLVSFMLTSLGIVRALCEAARSGCKVSVLTLPSDMVRARDRAAVDRVKEYHEELKSRGRLEYADLEIGDPRRTTTSQSDVRSGEVVGRKWYALHAKFLVTDGAVVMTSANCGHQFAGRAAERTAMDERQWEVHWRYDDPALAEQYVAWHGKLARLLRHDSSGSLWQRMMVSHS